MKPRIEYLAANRWTVLASRLILGGIFVAASIGKLQHPALFTDTVVGYGMLPEGLARFYGTVLPWVEIFIGCSLVLGIFPAIAAAITVPVTLSFAIAGIYSLIYPVGDACGCFGELVTLSHWQSLLIDAAMLLMAGHILLQRHKAEFLGVAAGLQKLGARMDRRTTFAFQSALLVLVALVSASAVGGAQSPPDDGVHHKPELLFLWYECPTCFEDEFDMLERLEQEYGDRIEFTSIDCKLDPETAAEFEVVTYPTMVLITDQTDDGDYTVFARFDGPDITEQMLRDSFDDLLANEAGQG